MHETSGPNATDGDLEAGTTVALRSHAAEPAWLPGDVVLDADGDVWQRASEEDAAAGWPWHQGVEYVRSHGMVEVPEGATADKELARPLTLLVRAGQPVQTVVVAAAAGPNDLTNRLIRHGEQLRAALDDREQDAAGNRLTYDEELHSAAYRLLTTIDLLTSERETP